MADLKAFRRANKLNQETVAKFLGVTRGYLSHVETGICDISVEQLEKLLANDRSWDTSALIQKPNIIRQTIGSGSSNNTQVAGADASALQEKIAMLEKLLEEKERTIQILLNR